MDKIYSYVRICSIKRKAGIKASELIKKSKEVIKIKHDSEVELALHIRQFPETLEIVVKDLFPNRLCDFLYELSEKFNNFFRDCKVIGSEEENSRFLLCEATLRTMEICFNILGLKTIDKM